MKLMTGLMMGLLATGSMPLANAGFFAPSSEGSMSFVEKAHESYLANDFKSMALNIREALKQDPNDATVLENVSALLSQTYSQLGNSKLPVDWKLPREIPIMKVGVRLSERDGNDHTIRLYGTMEKMGIIKQLRLVRYPDIVIADKEAGVGSYEEEPGNKTDGPEYGLQSRRSQQPIDAGLYLIHLELTNGKNMDGWFVLENELNSTETPRVAAPAYGEIFNTATPTFRWQNFTSPQYQPNERRSVWVGVSRFEAPRYDWKLIWEQFEDAPTLQEATVGIGLENGHYLLVLKYNERKHFGDLVISRESATLRPFSIQR